VIRIAGALAAVIACALFGRPVAAQTMIPIGPATDAAPFGAPVDDQRTYSHGLFDQLEARVGEGDGSFRWDGEAWIGTDTNRLWLKSEGERDGAAAITDGRLELLYDHPATTYFDAQAGIRQDLDSRPGRTWAAFGLEGLAPYFLQTDMAVYASGDGHLAARARVSYDQLLTQRLILSPEIEANLYDKDDPQRLVGAGLSDLDAGLRLRYEITRKVAPYLGVIYEGRFGRTAQLVRAVGERPSGVKVAVGLRGWF